MNHESDNFYAEMLLKQLAAAAGKVGTSAGGSRIVVASMREAGIPVAGVRIVDGSGLSSLDRLPAQALVGVIGAAVADPTISAVFVDSLAVAGQERNAARPAARAPRPGEGQDGDDEPRLLAVGRDRRHHRVRRARERQPGLVLVGEGGAGPLRDDPGPASRACSPRPR